MGLQQLIRKVIDFGNTIGFSSATKPEQDSLINGLSQKETVAIREMEKVINSPVQWEKHTELHPHCMITKYSIAVGYKNFEASSRCDRSGFTYHVRVVEGDDTIVCLSLCRMPGDRRQIERFQLAGDMFYRLDKKQEVLEASLPKNPS